MKFILNIIIIYQHCWYFFCNSNLIPRSNIVIDLGIKKLLTLSNKVSYDNNKYIEKYEKIIKRVQRKLSRKVSRTKLFR